MKLILIAPVIIISLLPAANAQTQEDAGEVILVDSKTGISNAILTLAERDVLEEAYDSMLTTTEIEDISFLLLKHEDDSSSESGSSSSSTSSPSNDNEDIIESVSNSNNNGNSDQSTEDNTTQVQQEQELTVTCWDNTIVSNSKQCPPQDLFKQTEPLPFSKQPSSAAAAVGEGGSAAAGAMIGPSTIITDEYLMPALAEDDPVTQEKPRTEKPEQEKQEDKDPNKDE